MDLPYKKILPTEVFISIFDREPTEAELWTNTVYASGNRPSGNNFIDQFAMLIRKYGKRSVLFYARKMGIDKNDMVSSIRAMSGISALEWISTYVNLAACELLEHSDKSITEIAQQLNFNIALFSQFFLRMNKCSPYEWRSLKRHGKKMKYHY